MNGQDVETTTTTTLTEIHEAALGIPVPIPRDLPPPPDLTHLPIAILHSGTVETLIGQNEDLFARLKVTIRRVSVLESQAMEQDKTRDQLMRANDALMAQLQVFEEKDQLTRDKISKAEAKQIAAQNEAEHAAAKLALLEKQNRMLHGAARFQRRISRWVKPMIAKLKRQIASEQKASAAKNALISDLRASLAEATQHAHGLESQFIRDQARLVEQYESSRSQLESELEKLKNESKLLRDKAMRLDQAIAVEAACQNRIVLLERQCEESALLNENLRKEYQRLQAQHGIESEELHGLRIEIKDLQGALSRTSEQFESLQTVWADAQKRLETSKLQHETLNKLNQELSRQLKEQRQSAPPARHPESNM